MTGTRPGEAIASQWQDIDFNTGILVAAKPLVYKNVTTIVLVMWKLLLVLNTLFLLDRDTLRILKHWKAVQSNLAYSDLSYNGNSTQNHTISHAITKYAKLADVHRITVHGLRNSHASFYTLNENPIVLKDQLGHKDIETKSLFKYVFFTFL